MLLSKIINSFKNELEILNFKDQEINGIESDSRLIKKNDIFFALDGLKSKGIDFADKAIDNGATVIVCSKKYDYNNNNLTIIKCDDSVEMLGKFLNVFYPNKPKHIVGITGTSGKTSTAEFTRQIIQNLGHDSASIGTLGVKFKDEKIKSGTLTMLETVELHQKLNMLKAEKNIDYVSMEFSSQGMHQRRGIGINVDVAVFLNLSPEHLDYHKTMEEYFKQKTTLFTKILKDGGTAVLNADVPEFEKLEKICNDRGVKIISFGKNGDIKIKDIKPLAKGQNITILYQGKEYLLELPFIGTFQAMNVLTAISAVVALNIESSFEKILKAVNGIKQAEGRMQLAGIKSNGATIYVDYAHKPDALQKVLEATREHINKDSGSRIFILFGCGGDRDKTKRPVMGKIANDLADVVIITDDNPRTEDATTIRQEVASTCPKAYNIGDRKQAIEKAIDMLEKDDILILAGKGHEKYTIIGKELSHFDEFEIVRDYLNKIK